MRFTSPHPRDFTDDVILAMATTANVCPQLHMPLQSGSDDVLRRMRRSYRRDRYLGILDRVRQAIPHAAISTDIIVGFPGETESDFADTLSLVEQARFVSAYTFQYSVRAGTPAALLPDQVPRDVVQERYERLVELQRRISHEQNQALIGSAVEVLVATAGGSKDSATGRRTGRARDGRLVHFAVAGNGNVRPGDVVTTRVSYAAPHHLVADGPLLSHRTTSPADRSAIAGTAGSSGSTPVSLGMPRLTVGS